MDCFQEQSLRRVRLQTPSDHLIPLCSIVVVFRPHAGPRRFLLRLAALVLLVSCLAAIPAQGQDSITVGVVMPITGREAKPGLYQKEGIELAIKQINDLLP